MKSKIAQLISIAEKKMEFSKDPLHDLEHVKRVVNMVQTLGKELDVSEKHIQALTLAAWWHDVGRTVTTRPSMLFMILRMTPSELRINYSTISTVIRNPKITMSFDYQV